MDKKIIQAATYVLACLSVILGLQLYLGQSHSPVEIGDSRPFVAIKYPAVAKIQIERPSGAFTAHKMELGGSDYFAIAEKGNCPVNEVVPQLVDSVLNITLVRKQAADPAKIKSCGLDRGAATHLALYDAGGKLLAGLSVGKKIGAGRFISLAGEIFLTQEDIVIPESFDRLANYDFPKLSPRDIRAITFSFPREKGPNYEMERKEGDLFLSFASEEVEAEDPYRIAYFWKDLSGAKICDIDAAGAGLNDPVAVVKFHLKGGVAAVVSIGDVLPRADERAQLRQRYVAVDLEFGSSVLEKISTSAMAALSSGPVCAVKSLGPYFDFKRMCGKHVWTFEDGREFQLLKFHTPVLANLDTGKIAEISLARKDRSVTLPKKDGKWLVGGYDFPAQQSRIDSLMSSLKNVKSRPGDIANDSVRVEDYADAEEGNLVFTVTDETGTRTLAMARERKSEGSLFRESDIRDFADMAARLSDLRSPVSRLLFSKFPAELQEDLKKCRPPVAEDLKKDLIVELDNIVKGPSLYQKPIFDKVKLRQETQELAEQGAWDSIRLNRMLLEDAYPHDIVKSQKNLVDDVAEVSDSWGNYYIKPSGKLTFGTSGPGWFPMDAKSWLHRDVMELKEKDIAAMELNIGDKTVAWKKDGEKLVAAPEFSDVKSERLISALGFLSVADVVKQDEETVTGEFGGQAESLHLKAESVSGVQVVISLKGTDARGYRLGTITASSVDPKPETPPDQGEKTEEAKKLLEIQDYFAQRIVRFNLETANDLYAIPLPKKNYDSAQLTAVKIESQDKTVELKRNGDDWKVGDKYALQEKIDQLLKQLDDLELRYGSRATSGSADDITVTVIGQTTDVYKIGKAFAPEEGASGKYKFLELNGEIYLIREWALEPELDSAKWEDLRVLRLETEDISAVTVRSPGNNIEHEFAVKDGKIRFSGLPDDHVMRGTLERDLDAFFTGATKDKIQEQQGDIALGNEIELTIAKGGEVAIQFSDPKDGEVYFTAMASGVPWAEDLQAQAGKLVKVSSAEIEKFMKDRASLESLEVQTSHILVSWKGTKNSTAKRSVHEARKRIEEVLQKLAEPGADFGTIAKEYSDDPSAKEGSGAFPMPINADSFGVEPEYKKAALELKNVGDLSPVMQTGYGFHVIRRDK